MRFRLPEACFGIVLAGLELVRGADGTIEADESAAEALAPHDVWPADTDVGITAPETGGRRTPRGRSEDRRMLR